MREMFTIQGDPEMYVHPPCGQRLQSLPGGLVPGGPNIMECGCWPGKWMAVRVGGGWQMSPVGD